MTAPKPEPQDDIGPFYKALGGIALLGALVMGVFQVRAGRPIAWPDVVLYGIVAIVVLALIRPRKFDSVIKTMADKLPFTKYQKPPEPPA